MKIWVVAVILFIFIFWFAFFAPNRKYYKIQIIGTIDQIEKKPKSREIKIDTTWYFIERLGVVLHVGQKIVKKSDSWVITVYDSTQNVAFQDSLKNVVFRLSDKQKNKGYKKTWKR